MRFVDLDGLLAGLPKKRTFDAGGTGRGGETPRGGAVIPSGAGIRVERGTALPGGSPQVIPTRTPQTALKGPQQPATKGPQAPANQRGVGEHGWRGDQTWRADVNTVRNGGTIESFNGRIPTKQQAIDMINEAGGRVVRIEAPHSAPNPHTFHHINFTTACGARGTIRILP